eukprot:COSAG02_NODE_6512_length_3526_cov_1.616574_2_plen_106_part_00
MPRAAFCVTHSGYPFLGNDFFAEMGDVFACHAIDNPDQSSEMEMLRSYAPDLDVDTIMSLSTAFMDLRAMQDTGELLYPYVAWRSLSLSHGLHLCKSFSVGGSPR